MRIWLRPRSVAIAVAWGLTMSASPFALAQPTPEGKAIAETLFRDGRALMDEGRYPEACRKLEESQRLDPALGTLLNMAVCHEKEGKIATAWAEFNEAMVLARREGRQDRFDLAQQHMTSLEPDLPKLVLNVPPQSRIPGLEILRNGTPIGVGAWGTPLPIDPGEVIIEARAPKYKPWTTTLQIEIREQKSEDIPLLESMPEDELTTGASAGTGSSRRSPPPPPEDFWTANRIAGVTLAGVGIAAMGIGSVFGVTALNNQSDREAYCSGKTCSDQRGIDLNKDAMRNANIANITIGAGALVGAVGALLFFSGGSDAPTEMQSGVDISFTMMPSQASAGVRGTW